MNVVSVVESAPDSTIPGYSSWIIDDWLPPIELTSSVFGIILSDNGEVLLTKNKRGWSFPGGHIEEGESFDEALNREVLEETDCKIKNIRPFGYREIKSKGEKPEGHKYPFPLGYVQFFLADLESMAEFSNSSETEDRKLFTLEEFKESDGYLECPEFYDNALNQLNPPSY